jgi:hypothetical protein
MAVFISILAVAVAMGCFVAILLSDVKGEKNTGSNADKPSADDS